MDPSEINKFWEDQARRHGEDIAAVNFDPLSDDFFGPILKEFVADGLRVADVGCGNGRNVFELAQLRPQGQFVGYDYTQGFLKVAEERRARLGLENASFQFFDATTDDLPPDIRGTFDVVISKRLLINLHGHHKSKAIENIHSMLKMDGIYIMSECFITPLERINEIRAKIGLPRIEVKPFNEYITESFCRSIQVYFDLEKKIDIDSLYYFISRIFNARLSGGKPDYKSPMNRLAAELVRMGVNPLEGYSPEITCVLRKKPLPVSTGGD